MQVPDRKYTLHQFMDLRRGHGGALTVTHHYKVYIYYHVSGVRLSVLGPRKGRCSRGSSNYTAPSHTRSASLRTRVNSTQRLLRRSGPHDPLQHWFPFFLP